MKNGERLLSKDLIISDSLTGKMKKKPADHKLWFRLVSSKEMNLLASLNKQLALSTVEALGDIHFKLCSVISH